MSSFERVSTVNMIVAEDFDDSLYELVTINSDGRCTKADAATEIPYGIVAENPGRTTVAGVDRIAIAPINLTGRGLVKASAAITRGHVLVASATDGKAAGVANIAGLAANQMGFGIALQAAAAADEIIEFAAMSIAG